MAKGPTPAQAFRNQPGEDICAQLAAAATFDAHYNDLAEADAALQDGTGKHAKKLIKVCGGSNTAKVALRVFRSIDLKRHPE